MTTTITRRRVTTLVATLLLAYAGTATVAEARSLVSKNAASTPVQRTANTPGALLFHFSSEPVPGVVRPSVAHMAISLGDGR